jgi:hypothetical protein
MNSARLSARGEGQFEQSDPVSVRSSCPLPVRESAQGLRTLSGGGLPPSQLKTDNKNSSSDKLIYPAVLVILDLMFSQRFGSFAIVLLLRV